MLRASVGVALVALVLNGCVDSGFDCNFSPGTRWDWISNWTIESPQQCPVPIPGGAPTVLSFEASAFTQVPAVFEVNTIVGTAWDGQHFIFCFDQACTGSLASQIGSVWRPAAGLDHFVVFLNNYKSAQIFGVGAPDQGTDQGSVNLFITPPNEFGVQLAHGTALMPFARVFKADAVSPTHAEQFTNVTATATVPSSGSSVFAGNYTLPLSYAWKFNNVTQASCAGSLVCTKQIGANGSYNTWKFTVTDGDGTQVTKQTTTIANTGGGCGDCVLRADPDAPSDSTVTTKISG